MQFSGRSPLRTPRTFPTAMLPIAIRVSMVAEAICGTMTTFSSANSPSSRVCDGEQLFGKLDRETQHPSFSFPGLFSPG